MVVILSQTQEYSTFITQMQQMTADYTERLGWPILQAGSTLIWYFHAQLPSKVLAKELQMPLMCRITSPLPQEQQQAIISTLEHKEEHLTYPNKVHLL